MNNQILSQQLVTLFLISFSVDGRQIPFIPPGDRKRFSGSCREIDTTTWWVRGRLDGRTLRTLSNTLTYSRPGFKGLIKMSWSKQTGNVTKWGARITTLFCPTYLFFVLNRDNGFYNRQCRVTFMKKSSFTSWAAELRFRNKNWSN